MGDPAALDGMARALLRRGRDVVPADRRDRAARRRSSPSPSASAPGCPTRPPTARSRSGSTSRARSWRRARAGRTTPTHLQVAGRRTASDPRAARRRAAADHHRARAARRDRPDRLARTVGRRDLDRPLGGDRRRGAGGYAAGARSTTHLFNAMTGVDHRSPGVAVAALLDDDVYVELIADGIHVHPGAVAAHHPAQAARPAAARQRRARARRHGRRPRPDRSASRSRSRGGRVDAGRHVDAGRVGHRARQRGPEPRGRGRAAAGRRRGRQPQPARAARRHRTAAGSRSVSGPTSSSSTTDLTVRRVMRGGTVARAADASARRHRRERPVDVVEHPQGRRLGDVEVAPAVLDRRLAGVAPRAGLGSRGRPTPASRRRTRCGRRPGCPTSGNGGISAFACSMSTRPASIGHHRRRLGAVGVEAASSGRRTRPASSAVMPSQ